LLLFRKNFDCPIFTSLVLKIENFVQNWASIAEKFATSLFLHGESEKIGPETICRPPRFQLGRFMLTLSLNITGSSYPKKIILFPEKIISSPEKIILSPERIQKIKIKKKITNFYGY
jgi:hypothetical protein